MRILYIILLIFTFTFYGCHKDLLTTWKPDLEVSRLNINGEYINEHSSYWGGLWYDLQSAVSSKRTKYDLMDSSWVKLELTGDSVLKATLIRKDKNLDSLFLKGKLYNNYFSVNQFNKLIPLPPLFWLKVNYKLLLGNDSTNNLLVTTLSKNEGFLLLIGTSGGGVNRSTYNKKQ